MGNPVGSSSKPRINFPSAPASPADTQAVAVHNDVDESAVPVSSERVPPTTGTLLEGLPPALADAYTRLGLKSDKPLGVDEERHWLAEFGNGLLCVRVAQEEADKYLGAPSAVARPAP